MKLAAADELELRADKYHLRYGRWYPSRCAEPHQRKIYELVSDCGEGVQHELIVYSLLRMPLILGQRVVEPEAELISRTSSDAVRG